MAAKVIQNVRIANLLLSFLMLKIIVTYTLQGNGTIFLHSENTKAVFFLRCLHFVTSFPKQYFCVRKQGVYFDVLLQNGIRLIQSVSKVYIKFVKQFTECQKFTFLTNKLQEKRLFLCQYAVILHRQLTDKGPKTD